MFNCAAAISYGMKKIIISLVIIGALAAGWLVFKKPSKQTPALSELTSPTLSPSPTATITKEPIGSRFEIIIRKEGVSSQNLNIKAGDTVIFVNKDTALHWPAAGTHPTHNLCPGFDPLHGLTQGETFSFTFNQAGVCPFHDHLNARKEIFSGVIIVEGGK